MQFEKVKNLIDGVQSYFSDQCHDDVDGGFAEMTIGMERSEAYVALGALSRLKDVLDAAWDSIPNGRMTDEQERLYGLLEELNGANWEYTEDYERALEEARRRQGDEGVA